MQQSDTWIKTTCPYCGVGCGVEARQLADGKVDVRGDSQHPSNHGLLCSKGTNLGDTLSTAGRLLRPLIKGQPHDWARALDYVAHRFGQVLEEHGPESIAFYVSGQLLTEDYYVANKLMKGFIGGANIDTNSRLCMSSAVAGHKRAFGSDTVPGCYEDLELAQLVVLAGSNLAWCHPILYQRLKRAKQANPAMKVVVIDPRATDSLELADLHLQLRPGSDISLFNGLLHHLASHDALDEDYIARHTRGFDGALAQAREQAGEISQVATATGLPEEQLLTFYQWFAGCERTVTAFSMGINQSIEGVDKVNSIINCHLATGRVGKPGASPFSVTGQPNAMGGREVGGLANTLAAHLEFDDSGRAIMGEFWQTDRLAVGPGLKAVDLFKQVHAGKIKALWVMGTNPAVSLPDSQLVREALLRCPLVVASDCIADTDTNRFADVLLPARGWGEKSGTVTNSERRISRQRAFLAPTGEARPDWWIICEVARRMGFGDAFGFASEAEIFAEHARLSGFAQQRQARDFDISALENISREEYDLLTPFQWPARKAGGETQRLFAEGGFFHEDGKARLVPVSHQGPQCRTSEAYPLILNSGRVRDHWHTMTRTGLSAGLSGHLREPLLSMTCADASRYGVIDGQVVRLVSEAGSQKVRLKVDDSVAPGGVFMPIHWNRCHSSDGLVSQLLAARTDPLSGQPQGKYMPVRVECWDYQTELRLVSPAPLADLPVDYWVRQTLEGGYQYLVADRRPAAELLAALDQYWGRASMQRFDYHSEQSGYRRGLRLAGNQLRVGYLAFAAGAEVNDAWFAGTVALAEEQLIHSVLAGKLQKGDSSPIICACHQVRQQKILDVIEEHDAKSVQDVGEICAAGTNCGSCQGQIKQLLRQTNATAEATLSIK